MTQTKRVATRVWMQRLRADADITKVRLCTLVILGTYMDSDGSNAHVRESTLAAAVGISDRAVRDHLSYACDRGYLNRVARGHRLGNGETTASTYEATVPDGTTGSQAPVEDGEGRAQPEPGRRLSEPQPEAGRSTTGRSGGLNRNGDAPQPEPGRSPNKEDQVPLQEQTDLSPAATPADLVREAGAVPAGDEREFIDWVKIKFPDRGIGWWRTICGNGDVHTHAADWKHGRDTAPPARPPLPEHCGACGDLGAPMNPAVDNPRFRYRRDETGWREMCPCHPDHPGTTNPPARTGRDQPPDPNPPPRPPAPGPPASDTGPRMTSEQIQATIREARRKAQEARGQKHPRPASPPPTSRDATDEEKEHQRQQMAVIGRYTKALADGMTHEQAERHARAGDDGKPDSKEGPA